jgi:hypothetical protein
VQKNKEEADEIANARDLRRKNIAMEIYQTEKSYVAALTLATKYEEK